MNYKVKAFLLKYTNTWTVMLVFVLVTGLAVYHTSVILVLLLLGVIYLVYVCCKFLANEIKDMIK